MDNKALADAFDRCKAVQLATLKNLQETKALIFGSTAPADRTKTHKKVSIRLHNNRLTTANDPESESTDDL